MLNNLLCPLGLFKSSASAVAQTSLFLGVPGVDVGKASGPGGQGGPERGFVGGHQGVGLAALYGEEGTGVRTEWGAREVVIRLGEYAADVVDSMKKHHSLGLFFFTPLVHLVLSKRAEVPRWLDELRAYRTQPAPMSAVLAALFSDPFLHLLKAGRWVFDGTAADFIDRLYAAMVRWGIGRPPAGTHRDFLPGAVVAYVEALLGQSMPSTSLSGLAEDLAEKKLLYAFYRKVLVTRGQAYARAWGIPYHHELMVGEGELLRMWAQVFDRVPFEVREEQEKKGSHPTQKKKLLHIH